MPYLLIVADRKDGMLELLLFHKAERDAELVAQRKLPFSVNRTIAGKLTGALIQQIQLRRKMGTGTVQSVLKDFESVFRRSDTAAALFRKLAGLLQEQTIRFAEVSGVIEQIVRTCEFDFARYAPFFRMQPAQNTMLHLFNGAFMAWNGLMQLLRDFVYEQPMWKEDARGDLQVVMCGSLLRLACLAEPSMGNVTNLQFTPSNRQLLYQMSCDMFSDAGRKYFKFYLTINNAQYARIMQDAYARQSIQKKTAGAAPVRIGIFAERMLAIPADAGVYAGHVGGRKLPFNGILLHHDEAGNRLLAAPFSEAFSALIAAGQITFHALEWEQQEDGWLFTVRCSYNGKQMSLRPRLYREEQITQLDSIPDLVMYKAPGRPEMYLSCSGGAVRAELYNGKKQEGRIRLDEQNENTYLRLYRDQDGFLGQVDYRVKKKGGGQNG